MIRKPLFDILRRLLGRPFRQDEVDLIDATLDDLDDPDSKFLHPHTIGPDGIALIKRFEGRARRCDDGMVAAYPDPGTGGAPWTIGWGSTGPGIGPDTVWTQDQCDERFARDLEGYAAEVADAIGDAPTTQAQFDALVSFHYNTGAIGRASLTRLHRAGDHSAAAREFARWKYAGGRVLRGLVKRRDAEAQLYLSDR